MNRLLAALSLLLAAALSGCATYTLLPAKEREVAPGFYLTPQVEWSAMRSGDNENWTIHGLGLENVFLAKGIADGMPLVKPTDSKEQMPLFRAAMTGSELSELAVETLQRRGATDVRVVSARPDVFGGKPGFRADLAMKTSEGLELVGRAAGAVVEGKLYLLLFTAPRVHYFAANEPTIDKVIASARFD
jgi:hypothetical protein